ncbi:MAG: hypothetical protein LBI26_01290 [Holosporales bacterium]|jgi:hypothetical protein|nr:hypothetical protein [Holosporales bacterium]
MMHNVSVTHALFYFEMITTKSTIFFAILICTFNAYDVVAFKAKAPESREDEVKNNFGSILKKKPEFFLGKIFTTNNVPSNTITETKKDKAWNAAIAVLRDLSLSISYAYKEPGIIKTDKAQVQEFDNTGSCLYKVTVNISELGDISILIKSEEDSETRIKKHQNIIKSRILEVLKTPPRT